MKTILYDGKPLIDVENAGLVSDGFHTFDEIYDHRCVLFLAFLEALDLTKLDIETWKSRKHADGEEWSGWFIAGAKLKGKQISYHLPEKFWKDCRVSERELAPEWDGHTSDDVLQRILAWVKE